MKEVTGILNDLIMAFIPLFVAIDVPGLVPLFLSLTEGMTLKARRILIVEATLTAGPFSTIWRRLCVFPNL